MAIEYKNYKGNPQGVVLVTSTGVEVTTFGGQATEVHLGQVGGHKTIIAVTPAITAGLYHAGDSIGGIQTITGAMRITAGSGILQSIYLIDKGAQKAPLEINIYSSNPAAATITDNAAFVWSTDIAKLVAQLSIGTADYGPTINGISIARLRNLGIPVAAVGSANLFASVITTVSPPTYATTSDLIFGYRFIPD